MVGWMVLEKVAATAETMAEKMVVSLVVLMVG
jgi:hypothetical protein